MITKSEFESIKQKSEELLQKYEKKNSLFSTLRAVVFLAAIALIIVGVSEQKILMTVLGIVGVVIFVALIIMHARTINYLDYLKNYILVVDKYIDRYSDEWRNFTSNGEEFLRDSEGNEDTVSSDLDILGKNSLYQMISVCHTDFGKEKLANSLKQKEYSKEEIIGRQEAIQELIELNDFALEFEAYGIGLEKKSKKFNPMEFTSYCKQTSKLPVWINVIRIIYPIIEVILVALWVLGITSYGYAAVGFLLGIAISWMSRSLTDSSIIPVYSFGVVVEDYIKILQKIASLHTDNEYLSNIIRMVSGDKGALKAIEELNKLSMGYNICYNPLIHMVLSGLFLWDYQLVSKVDKWKNKYGNKVEDYFECIGYLEELLSLSVLGKVRKTTTSNVRNSQSNDVSIDCKELMHPLLNPDNVVANSINVKGSLIIVTGSNMSGKTTFLRTIAINLVLGYIGAPVCAESLDADYCKIFTSMRVTDDVANGISTFYAEILRIKNMAEYKKLNKPMICFIDEIFKGTNSADRIVGAKEVITKLTGSKCITFVSTHDFELCEIQKESGCKTENYHFEEYYDDGELKFDYKMRNGRCTTTNAMHIIKMAGF